MRKPKTDPVKMLGDFILSVGGRANVKFDKSRCFFHFGIPALKLVVDFDRGYVGRHNWKRHNAATVLGWRYFKFTGHMVRVGIAAELIGKFIENNLSKEAT